MLLEFAALSWSRLIADIQLDNPDVYAADVKLWEASVLTDTADLMRQLGIEQ
jgi:hypothetical protein